MAGAWIGRFPARAYHTIYLPSTATPDVQISDGDTGAGVDAESALVVTTSSADTGVGVEAGAPDIPFTLTAQWCTKTQNNFIYRLPPKPVHITPQPIWLPVTTDTGTGDDAGETIAVSDTDTGTGVESGAPAIPFVLTAQWCTKTQNNFIYRLPLKPVHITPQPISVSDADTGTGVEASTIAATLSSADIGTGVDTESLALSSADTSTGVDAGETIAFTAPDTGSGTEAGLPDIPFAAQIQRQAQAQATKIYRLPPKPVHTTVQPIAIFDNDTGTGVDGGESIAVTDTDTGTAVDDGALANKFLCMTTKTARVQQAVRPNGKTTMSFVVVSLQTVSDSDSAAGVEAGTIAATLSAADTASGAETGEIALSSADTGNGIDGVTNIAVTSTDTASGVEGVPSVAVSTTDTGSGSESGSADAALASPDTGTAVEAGSTTAALSGSETGSGAEASSIVASLAAVDTGSGTETEVVVVSKSDSDTGAAVDTEGVPNATLSGSDACTSVEARSITATLSTTDLFTYLEGQFVDDGSAPVQKSSADVGDLVDEGVMDWYGVRRCWSHDLGFFFVTRARQE